MSDPSDAARLYFTPCDETFWRWSEDRQAVEWIGGLTIAHRLELQILLESLAPSGLPPFETILLTIVACRNIGKGALQELPQMLQFKRYPMRYSMVASVGNVVERLQVLHSLPQVLRTSMEGRKAILALICENGPRLKNPAFSNECLEYLRRGYAISAIAHLKTSNDWVSELRGLHDGLAAVNESAVRLRMEIGVEALPVPVPVTSIPLVLPEPEPVPLTVRELLKELERDEETAGLVHLTRRLLAVVSLPRPVSAPDDQPLGGVSDITNRGPFDRLLISELAQDTDVLMTRVALNEALYIRREVPPGFPPRERFVLLDAGIRMWGLPRLYATAAGLAMAALQDDGTTARLFRAATGTVVPLDLTKRVDLIEHLKSLELAPHPGDSLAAFIAQAAGTPTDFVIVTGEDVLSDPEFRICLNELGLPSLYVVAVTREGNLRLLLRTRQGERVIKQARLELEEILKGPQQAVPAIKPKLRNEAIDPHLPAICRVKPFPLRLYHQIDWKNCGAVDLHQPGMSLLAVTNDRRLMLWTSQQEGARQMCDSLPAGRLLWHDSAFDAEHRLCVIVGDLQHGKLSVVRVERSGEAWDVQPIESSGPLQDIGVHAGSVYFVSKTHIGVSCLVTGRTSFSVLSPDLHRINGRFFRTDQALQAFNAPPGSWQPIKLPGYQHPHSIKAVFDSQCRAAPVVVTSDNMVVVTGSNEALQFQQSCEINGFKPLDAAASGKPQSRIAVREIGVVPYVSRISPDGNRFIVSQDTGRFTNVEVDLLRLTATERRGRADILILGYAAGLVTRQNVRHKLSVIGVQDGHLVLKTAKQAGLKLSLDPSRGRLLLDHVPNPNLERAKGFQFAPAPQGVGYSLKIVQWKNGSRAYLDSRGLLHLQSSDDQIPEMTLVLNDANVAGWCDRNQVWGDPAFTSGYLPKISPERVFQDWLIPFCRRLV